MRGVLRRSEAFEMGVSVVRFWLKGAYLGGMHYELLNSSSILRVEDYGRLREL